MKPKPVIVERPRESIVIQIHQRRRGRKGTLSFEKSKSLTVYNLTLAEVYDRIKESLKE